MAKTKIQTILDTCMEINITKRNLREEVIIKNNDKRNITARLKEISMTLKRLEEESCKQLKRLEPNNGK